MKSTAVLLLLLIVHVSECKTMDGSVVWNLNTRKYRQILLGRVPTAAACGDWQGSSTYRSMTGPGIPVVQDPSVLLV